MSGRDIGQGIERLGIERYGPDGRSLGAARSARQKLVIVPTDKPNVHIVKEVISSEEEEESSEDDDESDIAEHSAGLLKRSLFNSGVFSFIGGR